VTRTQRKLPRAVIGAANTADTEMGIGRNAGGSNSIQVLNLSDQHQH